MHEAAHATACCVMGWPLELVEVGVVDEGNGQTRIGRCRPAIDFMLRPDARGVLQFPSDYAFRRRYCAFTLAGPVAEFLLLPDPPEKPCSDDMRYAREDAATVFPNDDEYQHKFLLLCGHDAARLVRTYAEEIERVARALLERRRLTGRQVNHLLRS